MQQFSVKLSVHLYWTTQYHIRQQYSFSRSFACLLASLAGCKLVRVARHTLLACLSFPCVSTFGPFFFFSILCLTTHLIHQGHEKRKEIRDDSTFTAQHVRAALSVLHMAQKIVSRQKHNMLSLLHAACLKLLVFFIRIVTFLLQNEICCLYV